MVIPNLNFETSEDIMTKFESQALYIIRNPDSLIPALWKIAILGLKMKFLHTNVLSILFHSRPCLCLFAVFSRQHPI